MGRIYGVGSGLPGERSALGCRIFTHKGVKIPFVSRVIFGVDADEGMATVTAFMTDSEGNVLVDYQRKAACSVTFQTWVQLVHPDQPDPPKRPNAMLWDDGNGGMTVSEDPFPAVPFTKPEAANV